MFLTSAQSRKRQNSSPFQEARERLLAKSLLKVDQVNLQRALFLLFWSHIGHAYLNVFNFIKLLARLFLALLVRIRHCILNSFETIPKETIRKGDFFIRLLQFYWHNIKTKPLALNASRYLQDWPFGARMQDNKTLLQSHSTSIREFKGTFYCYQRQDEYNMDLCRRQPVGSNRGGSNVGNNTPNDTELESPVSCCWPSNYPSTLPGQQNINMPTSAIQLGHRLHHELSRRSGSHEAQGQASNLSGGAVAIAAGSIGGSSALVMPNTRSIVYSKPTNDTSREIQPLGDLRKHDCSSARRPLIGSGFHDAHHLQHYRQDYELQACCGSKQQWLDSGASESETMHGHSDTRPPGRHCTDNPAEVGSSSMMLVSKEELCDLSASVAFSISKMQQLEEKVRIIPELQRRLENVIADNNTRDNYSQLGSAGFRLCSGKRKDATNSCDDQRQVLAYQTGESKHCDLSLDHSRSPEKVFKSCADEQRYFVQHNSNVVSGSHNYRLEDSNTSPHDQRSINSSSRDGRANKPDLAPRSGYDDLLNDLLSLSYSVNCEAQDNKPSVESATSARLQVKEPRQQLEKGSSMQLVPNQEVKSVSKQSRTSSMHIQAASPSNFGRSYLSKNLSNSGSLSLNSTPVKSPLDCGCSSFRDHLRYNSISREQRLAQARPLSVSTSNTSQASTMSPQPKSTKVDASTNTDLFMNDVMSKLELSSLISSLKGSQNSVSISRIEDSTTSHQDSSPLSETLMTPTSHSISSSESSTSNEVEKLSHKFKLIALKPSPRHDTSEGKKFEDDDDDDDDDPNSDGCSLADEEPCSLGSSYQDPSDFEEYCAYGETLERRTKDFMSKSTNIPNDLRFALVSLNNHVRRGQSFEDLKSTECLNVIRKEWFDVAAMKDSTSERVKLYVDYLESFTKQLLNTVINLTDNAGNTVIHYAASHYKFDIIKVLLDTKVCDVNCRNKAGYTPIMLLALADITKSDEQDIARQLFNIGDVNIKARSSGQTALMLAARHGRLSTCRLLLECAADPSLQDLDGSTALMCASEFGNVDVVRCLLASKLTDPTATDNDGMDALTIAMNNSHRNIALILYAAKNIPRMIPGKTTGTTKSKFSHPSYLGASMRKSRGKLVPSFVKRADSLLGTRSKVTK